MPHTAPAGFRLMRYFTLSTAVAFVTVGAVLYFLQRNEEAFFAQVQREQAAFFRQAQDELAQQHEEASRATLLAVHEANHVNLTRLVANMLWASDFGPFLAASQRLPVAPCLALPAEPAAARRDCFAEMGRRLVALPAFKTMDAKAYAAMQSTTVFKIKVFDMRGITVYSSEHRQIGEYAAENAGWRSAAEGQPASELTHRDRFSAFERTVENRDLISTYVPVRSGGGDAVLGVVELYSDVTPFLDQIRSASRRFAQITSGNQTRVESTARSNQDKVVRSSDQFLVIVGSLILLLYMISLAIVRVGQRIIDRQAQAQAEAAQREQRWHREKMAALATMAANVAHEVGNPLAVIQGVAGELPDSERNAARQIRSQGERIARMMRQIADFAAARSESPEWVDVNAMLKAVCEFLTFDRRFRSAPIEFRPGAGVPACELVPDHLNEVVMNLLQACVDDEPHHFKRVVVETHPQDDRVLVRIGGATTGLADWFALPRLEAIRRRIADMGADAVAVDGAIEITLPTVSPEPNLSSRHG
ncbi:histidine kinase dimerization/phospho-acceptor domain-containing protein [uncultured Piscinibacter sp.]|uniref:sensor histidine kinase n=1 Tax=uncultured Piscinibacter sp. TaxID=1131835 RepID=UPI0026237C3D|nr:histidine kinase dimerization/phospho-acceptor domain-containing protein [uncultured Piscinibacter sp.]